ncbi:bifunctional DNA primase/polymerase [Limosilactobacillus difficilis]|uniref:bifunctional DNA primase/polymerase n=1 Tax=Limosilactobacillus difficilis TaxID=2991838 RepID=UPI0024BADAFB|nr:bifunctional DNA primase/polymerase [Limosilactobacillus difficilis]
MQSLLKYAIQYAEHGFSVVPTIGKKPLIKFADQPAMTPDNLRKFWRENKYLPINIALKTEQFFVVDVDRHPGGNDGTQAIKDLNHPEWFKTLCQKTAHNGFQFFFKKPAERITQNIGFLPGVDIKAHPNNYVVVAPSLIDHKRYKWVNHQSMIEPPEELIQLIEKKAEPEVSHKQLTQYHPKGHTKTSELFEQIVKGLGPTGGRNNALAAFAGGLLFRNVDPNCVLELARIANSKTPDKLPDKEVITTVDSMIKKELRRVGENDG